MREAEYEWTTQPVIHQDGTEWKGLAYVVQGRIYHGPMNVHVATGLAAEIRNELAQLREQLAVEQEDFQRQLAAYKELYAYHPKASQDTNSGEGAAKQSGAASSALCEVGIGGDVPPTKAVADRTSDHSTIANSASNSTPSGRKLRNISGRSTTDGKPKPEPTFIETNDNLGASHKGDVSTKYRGSVASSSLAAPTIEQLHSELVSERDWTHHLRIQLAAEVEKVNKLQAQLDAEREQHAQDREKWMGDIAKGADLREQLAQLRFELKAAQEYAKLTDEQLDAERERVKTIVARLEQTKQKGASSWWNDFITEPKGQEGYSQI